MTLQALLQCFVVGFVVIFLIELRIFWVIWKK
jgi:hypothetical protein